MHADAAPTTVLTDVAPAAVCSQMLDPPHSVQVLRWRPCSQMASAILLGDDTIAADAVRVHVKLRGQALSSQEYSVGASSHLVASTKLLAPAKSARLHKLNN